MFNMKLLECILNFLLLFVIIVLILLIIMIIFFFYNYFFPFLFRGIFGGIRSHPCSYAWSYHRHRNPHYLVNICPPVLHILSTGIFALFISGSFMSDVGLFGFKNMFQINL